MIIEYDGSKLLDASHVVQWESKVDPDDSTRYAVIATTVLNTTIKVFTGTQTECQDHLGSTHRQLNRHYELLRSAQTKTEQQLNRLIQNVARLVRIEQT